MKQFFICCMFCFLQKIIVFVGNNENIFKDKPNISM